VAINVVSWVLEQSEAKLGARLVLLSLADHAKADGSAAWPSVDTIARHARMSRRAVQESLRRLEADGAIMPTGRSSKGTTVYRVRMVHGADSSAGGAADGAPGAQITTSGGEAASPEPSENRQEDPSGKKNARILSPADEPEGFAEWLGHHSIVCKLPVPRAETRARTKLAQAFRNLVLEGRTMHELKAASTAMAADEWRMAEVQRRTPAVLLRPQTIDTWLAKGLELESAEPSRFAAFDDGDPRYAA
jgi:hypothetical protein